MDFIAKEYNLLFKHPFTISKGTKTHQPTLIVELNYLGIKGYGEAPAISYYDLPIEKMLEDSVVQAKIESAKTKSSELGYEFEVWTEMDLFGHVYNKKNMNLFIEKIRNGEV